MSIIEVNNVTKVFPPMVKDISGIRYLWDLIRGRAERVRALKDLSFSVEKGEIFGLLGPNGAGKTTLCKILNALVLPNSGSVSIFGLDAVRHHRKITENMLTIFGGDAEIEGVFGWRISIRRNLMFVADLWKIPGKEAKKRIEFALDVLDFKDKGDEWYQKLSGGTKQKLLMAVPLVIQPRLLLLDEPTIRLDVMTRKKVFEILTEYLNKKLGTTIFLTTHQIEDAERVCGRVAIINKGELAAIGNPGELVRKFRTRQNIIISADSLLKEHVNAVSDMEFVIGLRTKEISDSETEIEIETRCGPEVVPCLMDFCRGNGIGIRNFSVNPVSLEEVFVDLVHGPGEVKPDAD